MNFIFFTESDGEFKLNLFTFSYMFEFTSDVLILEFGSKKDR